MEPITVKFLNGQSDAGLLQRLHDEVFVPSFPPEEREPLDVLARVLDAGELHGAVALTPDGTPAGALFLEWFAGIRAGLLCYFAVRPGLRGHGIGRQLMHDAPQRWRAELRPLVVYAEAEDPRFHDDSPGYGNGEDRLRLYAGHGVRRLPLPYLVPELSPGAGRLPHMLLLVAEAAEAVRPEPARIRSAPVADFLTHYYTRMEGPVRPDDLELQALLGECRRAECLELLELQ